MALDYSTENIGIINNLFEGSSEQGIDCDISLPDFCPDIIRVLKCTVEPNVISSKISGDRVSADGNALIRIVYADEKNNICSVEHTVPFSKYIETGGEKQGSLYTEAKMQYVNCRAVSRRKAEIHGIIHFSFKITNIACRDFICDVENDDVQTKTESFDFSDVASCECKQFPINETMEIPSDYLSVQRVVNISAVPIVNEAKIIKGKVLLKGEVDLCVLYCSEEGGTECIKYNYSIPLNQVLEVQGASDEGSANADLKVISCECNLRGDSDGEPRLIDTNLVFAAEVRVYNKKEASCITDAYSTHGELAADYETVGFSKLNESINDTFTYKNEFDFSSLSAQNICCVWFGEIKLNKHIQDGKLHLQGSVPMNAIVVDGEGKPVFCEREFEFEYSRTINSPMDSTALVQIALSGYSVGSVNDGKAEIKAEFVIHADIFSTENKKVLVKAELKEANSNEQRHSSMIIYFADDDEKIWDIARKYGTTQEMIKQENSLTEDFIKGGNSLIIPIA